MNTLYIIGSCFNVLYLCEEEEEVGERVHVLFPFILSQLAQLVKSLQAQNFIIKVKLINALCM